MGWHAALNLDVERGEERGGDYVARFTLPTPEINDGFTHVEVRQTSFNGTLLLYPKNKWSHFEGRRGDLFVLVKTIDDWRQQGLLWQGFCRGWCTKDFFRKNHIISIRARPCEIRGLGIDKGTPYVEEHMLEFMDTFPIPQDYRLMVLPRKRLVITG
jgi:hypothetical protein